MNYIHGRTKLRLIVAIPSIMFLFTMGAAFMTIYIVGTVKPHNIDYSVMLTSVVPWTFIYGLISLIVSFLIALGLTKDLPLAGSVKVAPEDG